MAHASKEFIAEVLERCDIADVIGSRIKIQKKGHEYMACCPFHNEKTPSFTVSPQKQFYYCFGCHAHGSALDFLMRYSNLQFLEALQNLANSVGMEMPSGSGPSNSHKELFSAMQAASTHYQTVLRRSHKAVNYLKQRGISGEIAKRFAIGFSNDAWHEIEAATKTTSPAPKHRQNLIDCGLLIAKNSKTYDRFRDRIMFPIRNTRGDCIAFGGRVLSDDKQPKYLNSPETPIFHKGNVLYGLFEAKSLRIENYIVVEGYMDVVALAMHGIDGAVACLGTALTKNHINLLQRFGKTITLCFDGDKAGKRAAWRALETTLPLMRSDVAINFLELTHGHDPDSYVQEHGRAEFQTLINDASSLIDYMFEQLKLQHNVQETTGRIQFAEAACKLCAGMPQGLFKTALLQDISARSAIPLADIEHSITKLGSKRSTSTEEITNQQQEPQPNLINIRPDPILEQLIAWTIQHPDSVDLEHTILQIKSNSQVLKILKDCIQSIKSSPKRSGASLLALIENQHIRDEINKHLVKSNQLRDINTKAHWQALADSWQEKALQHKINRLIEHGKNNELDINQKRQLNELIALKQKINLA